jgi:hypothetical protein
MGASVRPDRTRRSAIRRISEGRSRWRVVVESWPEQDDFRGRFLFCPDSADRVEAERESAAMLRGCSHEDVLNLAHDLPEDGLRRLLHSLG